MVPLWWYISLAVVLFVIGAAGVLLRRNILVVLMSLELLLNSVNINFIAFGRYYYDDFRGQVFAIFVIAITAAEVAVALGILVALVRNKSTLKVDDVTMMKG
ncbi:NADH-quinone oxidoreductase subunit NuoK [Sinorhizobium saheli]|uniref:NADH-quinone oxidoreductase subunit K n=1 Tax=Sinorhizobium saheli TaxID=36856 RepID=A0A178YCY0_SINSA|nr:NADH-quinone oxidoreductase subunit NuoK [Sinorhizobium saheli]MQW86244.1 NADH-quinone oxidoreductase subunit NuoK [Sinorhizobium saheli]OAP45297.1 NADH-quinone oxidoreductase subunit K [Sinorhizobium saheli]